MQRIDRRAITVVDARADHGATGDGTTDDTAAIAAAIAAAGAGGTTLLPKGTYIVTPSGASTPALTLSGARASLIAEPGTTIKLKTGSPSNSIALYVTGTDVTVRGVGFDLNAQAAAFGVEIRSNAHRATVAGCRVINGTASGSIAIRVDSANDVLIDGNHTVGCVWGVITANTTSPTRLVITGNAFDGTGVTGGDGVEINTPSGAASDVTVDGNVVSNYASSASTNGLGIAFAHVTRGAIANNMVTNCGLDGIHVEDGSTDITITGNVVSGCGRSGIAVNSANAARLTRGIVIDANVVDGCLTASGSAGIGIEGTEAQYDCVVSDNIVRACGRASATCYGIYLNTASYNHRVTNNIVSNTTGATTAGIRVDASTNVLLQGNRCYDDQGSPTQDHGVTIHGNQVDLHVLDNDLTGNGTAGIDLASIGMTTRVVYRNNAGHVTEASGTGSIASGATSATVTHGLAVTPTRIDVTLRENPTNDVGLMWVDTIGATTFAVNCRSDPGASNLDFGWIAEVA